MSASLRLALPLPIDVRLMNLTASVLWVGFMALVLAALGAWVARLPAFALAGVTVLGDVAHSSENSLRASVGRHLIGTLFTVDLPELRRAFESAPWVRQSEVRRVFPNRLLVRLQEHQPAAHWGDAGDTRLINVQGELFNPGPGDAEGLRLPRLDGPGGRAAEVLAMYRALAPAFAPLGATLQRLVLSTQGNWQALLSTGATIELGRGSVAEVQTRVERFVATLPAAAQRFGRALEAADLRHRDGYALRLQGITTIDPATLGAGKK